MELDDFLIPRVIGVAGKLLEDGHFPEAAFAAMKLLEDEVELAGLSGRSHVFPYSKVDSRKIDAYVRAIVAYHRNALAHQFAPRLGKAEALRVLAAASELLSVLGARVRSDEAAGLDDLVGPGKPFETDPDLAAFLRFMDGQCFHDDVSDGFFEDLALAGYSDEQMTAVVDAGLVEMDHEDGYDEIDHVATSCDTFKLTPLGDAAIGHLSSTSSGS